MRWKKIKTYTTLQHILYSHPLPGKPENKENYCIITFSKYGTVAGIARTVKDEVLLLEQYCPAVDRDVINLPGGRIDKKNPIPKEEIKREIKEETGYSFRNIKEISESPLFQNPTRITDKTKIFLAEGIKEISEPTSKEITEKDCRVLAVKLNAIEKLLLGEKEKISGRYLWPKNIKNKKRNIKKREICDMTTITALALYFLKKRSKNKN